MTAKDYIMFRCPKAAVTKVLDPLKNKTVFMVRLEPNKPVVGYGATEWHAWHMARTNYDPLHYPLRMVVSMTSPNFWVVAATDVKSAIDRVISKVKGIDRQDLFINESVNNTIMEHYQPNLLIL